MTLAGLHSLYQYEMTQESEQRVNNVLAEMPIDEYNNLVKQVKLLDVNHRYQQMHHIWKIHLKSILTEMSTRCNINNPWFHRADSPHTLIDFRLETVGEHPTD